MNIVMIAVHKRSNKIIGFRFLDTDSRKVQDVTYDSAYNVLSSGKVGIENIKVDGDKIVGSNGALQRYPCLVGNQLVGKSPLIILFELANNRYRVSNYMGEIVDIEESEAIRYINTEGIANGKVVNNSISSISGTYKQDKILKDMSYGSKLKAKMSLMGVTDIEIDENYMARAKNENIEKAILGKGILGIAEGGFSGCHKLREVKLPNTLVRLGDMSFVSCISLEEIVIPEGVEEIPINCFSACRSLKKVYLPNSLKVIRRMAFHGCSKLKEVSVGPNKIEIEYGAIPRGTRRVVRR